MSTTFAARRLEILAAAQGHAQAFLRFEPGRLRFSIGTSLADLAVPVEIAPDAHAILEAASVELALLLAVQHKRLVPGEEVDRLLLQEGYAGLPSIEPTLGLAGAGPDLKAAAAQMVQAHPALTGGLAGAWLGRGGKGRSLVGLWIELLRRAFEEMAGARGEETPLIVALALSADLAAAEPLVRQALPTTHADRWLRAGAMLALGCAAWTGLQRACRDARLAPDDPLRARLEAALAPSRLLGGRHGLQASGATIYGCELTVGVPRGEELVTRLASGLTGRTLVSEIVSSLGADEPLALKAEQAVAVSRLRDLLVQAVLLAEGQGLGHRMVQVRELLATPGGLASGAAEAGSRTALAKILLAAGPGGETNGLLERAARALRDWRGREPAASFGVPRDGAREEYASAAAALAADQAVDRLVTAATRTLSFRTGREAEGGAEGEWEAGRLYRLTPRPGPLLHAVPNRPAAHLFADVKDFTRRTTLVGQASMAEFLRNEFYVPILVAAKFHYGGMQHLADRGGVSLNNLLGDAISFTGQIDAMLQLAVAIRQAFAAYAARLQRQTDDPAVKRQLEELERSLQAQPAADRERALARARGEGLEAGVFVSHGEAPLVVVIEDEVFGHNRVAIADKINESARGTARAASARARADALLEAARVARHRPRLDHAWSVFIDRPLAFTIPAALAAQALAAARAGDLQGALRAVTGPVRQGIEAAAHEEADPPGDIYNCGAALSEEALTAFLEEVEEQRVIRRVELEPSSLPEEARSTWFYGDETLSLVACFHPDGRLAELFRRVGRAAFKGLGGVTVWELCAQQGGPALLVRLLGRSWFDGARDGAPSRAATSAGPRPASGR